MKAMTVLKRHRHQLAGAFFILLCLVLVWLTLVPKLQTHLEAELSRAIGREVSLGQMRTHLLPIQIEVGPVSVAEAAHPIQGASPDLGTRFNTGEVDTTQPWARIEKILIEPALMRSIATLTPSLAQLEIFGLQLPLRQQPNGQFNFADILQKIKNPQVPTPRNSTARFWIGSVSVRDSEIHFVDTGSGAAHRFTLQAARLSQLASPTQGSEKPTHLSIESKLDGASLTLRGAMGLPAAGPTLDLALNWDAYPLVKLNPWMKNLGEIRLGQAGGQLQIKINPPETPEQAPDIRVGGGISVQALELQESQTQAIFTLKQAALTWVPFAFRAAHQIQFTDLDLDTPTLTLALGAINQQTPLAAGSENAPKSAPAAAKIEWALSLASLKLHKGAIQVAGEQDSQKFLVDRIEVGGRGLTLQSGEPPEVRGEADLQFQIEGAPASIRATLLGTQAEWTADLASLPLANFAPWLPGTLPLIRQGQLHVQAQGRVDLSRPGKPPSVSLSPVSAQLKDLQLLDPQTRSLFASLSGIQLKGATADLSQSAVNIAEVQIEPGTLHLTRDPQGRLDFQRWGGETPPSLSDPASPLEAKPWQWHIQRLAMAPVKIRLKDPSGALQIPETTLRGVFENLSANPHSTLRLQTQIRSADRSQLAVDASVRPAPLSVQAKIDAKDVSIAPFQPLIDPHMNLRFEGGRIWTQGQLSLASQPQNRFNHVKFDGTVSALNVLALDKVNSAEFLRWHALSLPRIQLDLKTDALNQSSIDVGDVALVDFYSRLILNANGRTNVADVSAGGQQDGPKSVTTASSAARSPSSASADVPPAPSPTTTHPAGPKIRVGDIRVANGTVNFTDYLIRPNYSANITDLSGEVGGFRNDAPEPALIDLQGRVDGDVPITLTGTINPLSSPLFMDLAAAASGVDLASFTPYSGKWAGYRIEKGKLNVNAHYLIKAGQLQAQNRFVLDQFTLGERVDSPDAVDLPLQLAIALLKDRQGRIDLNLPISGSLEDPEFSIGGLVWTVVRNLITKAVTAPFSLLTGISNAVSEEDQGAFRFSAGRHDLDDDARNRLTTLGNALAARPGVTLEITGHADLASDRQGLKRVFVENALKAAYVKRRLDEEPSLNADGLAAEEVPPQAREPILRQLYDAANFEKPRNVIGLSRALPAEEMLRLLVEHQKVNDDEIRLLALRRANTVRDALRLQHGLESERLFIRDAQIVETALAQQPGENRKVQLTVR